MKILFSTPGLIFWIIVAILLAIFWEGLFWGAVIGLVVWFFIKWLKKQPAEPEKPENPAKE